MIKFLFTPFNDDEDRPIDVISTIIMIPFLIWFCWMLLWVYA